MSLSVRSRLCQNVFVLHCQGRIVAGEEVNTLEKALDDAAREVPRIVLEVHNIDRLDSLGIGLLVRYATRLRKRGGDIRLADAPPFVLSLLKLTMLTALLQVCANEEEALLSFFRAPSVQSAVDKPAGKVLVLDHSADLCAFIKTVLTQHGLEVRSTSLVHDAKVLLQVDRADYILTSGDSPRLCSENVIDSLKIFAPSAAILILPGDFKTRDALDATAALLHMFGLEPNPA